MGICFGLMRARHPNSYQFVKDRVPVAGPQFKPLKYRANSIRDLTLRGAAEVFRDGEAVLKI